MTLVALLAVTTGAWADETLLLTIESKDYTTFKSGSKTFDDMVTVTFSNSADNDSNLGWYATSTASLLTVAGTNGYTITSCKFYTGYGPASTGYTIKGESPSVYLSEGYAYTDANKSENIGAIGIKKIEVYGGVATATPVDITWDAATPNIATIAKMPAGNVTVSVEYYDLATLADKGLTAAEDAAAKTEAPLAVVADGAVTGGTLMYYVAPDENFSQADAIALAETQWSADIPTAETIGAAGTCYVWYYIKGDAEHSDTDPQRLAVTLLPEPTYTVEFAEGTPETDKWKAEPNAGVKKGQTVTVTYTGSKKIIGVKAEKKAAPKTLAEATSEDIGKIAGKDGKIYATKADAEAVATGNAVAMIAYVGTASDCAHGLAIALADESGTKTYEAAGTACSGKAAVTGGTWRLPSDKDWQYMFIGCGSSEAYSAPTEHMSKSYSGLASKLTTAQGDALPVNVDYWSSTKVKAKSEYAWTVRFGDYASFDDAWEGFGYQVRACLAF